MWIGQLWWLPRLDWFVQIVLSSMKQVLDMQIQKVSRVVPQTCVQWSLSDCIYVAAGLVPG